MRTIKPTRHRDTESMQGRQRAKVNVTLIDKAPFQTIWGQPLHGSCHSFWTLGLWRPLCLLYLSSEVPGVVIKSKQSLRSQT